MSTPNHLHSHESIEAETLLLLNIQEQHGITLENLGIVEKAKNRVDHRNLNHLSKPTVAYHSFKEDGTLIEKLSIRLATPSVNPYGHRQYQFSYAVVANVNPESVELMGDFTMQDYEAVSAMIKGLKDAKDFGVLPHLSSDLTTIQDPNAHNSMTKAV